MSTLSFFLPELIIFCGAIFLLLLGSFSQCRLANNYKNNQCVISPLFKVSYFAIIFCLFAIFFAVKNLNILLLQQFDQVNLMQMLVANSFNYLVKIFALIILLLIFIASFSFSQKIIFEVYRVDLHTKLGKSTFQTPIFDYTETEKDIKLKFLDRHATL